MHQDENNDPVWKLLGKAKPVEVDPFFAKKVVREARKLDESRGGFSRLGEALGSWFSLPRAVAAACVIALLAFAAIQLQDPATDPGAIAKTPPSPPAEVEKVPDEIIATLEATYGPEDVEEYDNQIQSLEYLDNLIAAKDASLLTDQDIASLLF